MFGVILNVVKNLAQGLCEILRYAQDDRDVGIYL